MVKNPVRHPVINGMKYCTGCYQTKEQKEFSVNSKKYGTLKPTCRECERERVRRYSAECRMMARPHLYIECDDCGKIYYKTKVHECRESEAFGGR